MTTAPSLGDLIDTYIRYRDYKKTQADDFAAKMKPYGDAMDLIEAQLLAYMNQNNVVQVKGAAGTAYQVMHTSVKMENREEYLQYLFGLVRDDDPMAADLITAVVPKEPITAYMEGHNGMLPPGILINRETVVNIRRS